MFPEGLVQNLSSFLLYSDLDAGAQEDRPGQKRREG